jgi:hypothetical protein
MRTRAAVLVALLALSSVSAFPIPSQPYEATLGFARGIDALPEAPFVSGRMQANATADGPFVAYNLTGFLLTGLTKVCWGGLVPDCWEDPDGGIQVRFEDGSGMGLQFPRPVRASLTSNHSLAAFVDASIGYNFGGQGIDLGPSIAAVHVEATMRLDGLPVLPETDEHDLRTNAGGIMVLDGTGHVEHAGATRAMRGERASVSFQGRPALAEFGTDATLTPFVSGTAHFVPADREATRRGVDFSRIAELAQDLRPSARADPVQAELTALLGSILDGALVRLPANEPGQVDLFGALGQGAANTTFLRFDSLAAESDGATLRLAGEGPLHIQSGRVQGAQQLVGFMPWWAWILWIAAIGLWIARLVRKPAPFNDKWDRLHWVPWVANPVAFLLAFWIWDTAVHQAWGISLLRGSGGSAGLTFLLVTQVLLGFLVQLVVVTPLSSILKSGSRFAGQGRFMGLHRPVALVVGFLVGSSLLLSYIDFMLGLLA